MSTQLPTVNEEKDEHDDDDLDMDPPAAEDAAAELGLQDLANSGADHSAVAGGQTAAPSFFQQLPENNPLMPPVVSSSYPGMAPQSTTAPTNAQANGSAGPMPFSYATMPTDVNSPMFVQQAADYLQNMQDVHFNALDQQQQVYAQQQAGIPAGQQQAVQSTQHLSVPEQQMLLQHLQQQFQAHSNVGQQLEQQVQFPQQQVQPQPVNAYQQPSQQQAVQSTTSPTSFQQPQQSSSPVINVAGTDCVWHNGLLISTKTNTPVRQHMMQLPSVSGSGQMMGQQGNMQMQTSLSPVLGQSNGQMPTSPFQQGMPQQGNMQTQNSSHGMVNMHPMVHGGMAQVLNPQTSPTFGQSNMQTQNPLDPYPINEMSPPTDTHTNQQLMYKSQMLEQAGQWTDRERRMSALVLQAMKQRQPPSPLQMQMPSPPMVNEFRTLQAMIDAQATVKPQGIDGTSVDLLTPSNKETVTDLLSGQNLQNSDLTGMWSNEKVVRVFVSSSTKMDRHRGLLKFLASEVTMMKKLKPGVSEAELKKFFQKLHDEHPECIEILHFLTDLRQVFDQCPTLLLRYDTSMESESVRRIKEEQKSAHTLYKRSLRTDSQPGQIDYLPVSNLKMFNAFEKDFLMFTKTDWTVLHKKIFGQQNIRQEASQHFRDYVMRKVRKFDVEVAQSEMAGAIPDWYWANVAFAGALDFDKSFFLSLHKDIVGPSQLQLWSLERLVDAFTQVEAMPMFKVHRATSRAAKAKATAGHGGGTGPWGLGCLGSLNLKRPWVTERI